MIHHTESVRDGGKVQMESDKFLVEMFLPEGAKRCCYSSLNAQCLAVSVLSRFHTFCASVLFSLHELEIST